MQRSVPLLLSLVVLSTASVCFAASSPWDGTWKLNEAKSKLTGDTFTLTALPHGGFHLETPGHEGDRDYTCDGKDYVVLGDITGTCKKIDDAHYEMAGKTKGQPDWHGTSVVSDGGKYLTNTAYLHRPDGSDTLQKNTYQRVGTGTGRAGTWRNVKSSSSVPDVLKITKTGDTLRSEMPAYKMIITAKLDGSLANIEAPDLMPDFTLRWKAESPTRLRYVQAVKGRTTSEGTQILSSDGKTMTEETWDIDSPGEKQTYVFEKQ